jgi:hypothetical protein
MRTRRRAACILERWLLAGFGPGSTSELDAILAERMSPAQHRLWWEAEGEMLGRLTPLEALWAAEREAVIELALGRPGADWSVPLISDAQADEIFERLERELRSRRLDCR